MELFSFFSLQSIVLLLVLLFLFSILFSNLHMKHGSSGKGFKNYPLVGSLPDFLMNRHRFLDWMTDVLATSPSNTATFWRPGRFNGVITADPCVVEYMLKTNFENYPKGKRFTNILSDFLGTGIFNSDGDLWKVQRKTASYEFNTKSLRNFGMDNVTYEIRSRLLPILDKACQSGAVIDLQDILERFTFDNVCKLAFNFDPACLGGGDSTTGGADPFMASFEEAAMRSFDRFLCPFSFLWLGRRFLNIGSEHRLKNSIRTVHQFAENIIRSRMEQRSENSDKDLLSRFIGTENASPEFLRDIVISFILAGRDSTSSALTWFFWLLSVNPNVEHNILNELDSIRKRRRSVKEETYGFEDLREMHYLHASLSEAMRLYPPIPIDVKLCLRDDVLPDGTAIKEGWFLSYHTYAMGRMKSIWGENCLEYLPERWLDDGGVCRMESPFRFPVFHAGPRVCLGKDMAYIQMKSIAASVLERFEIHVQNNDKCRNHKLSLTLRMKDGLKMKVKERSLPLE